jgi:hypothetical protein
MTIRTDFRSVGGAFIRWQRTVIAGVIARIIADFE